MTKQPGTLELIEHTGEIDLRRWFHNEDTGDGCTNALRAAFAEDPPDVSFPFVWAPDGDGRGGECPGDPAMLYIDLPIGSKEGTGHRLSYACSLEGAVDDLIDSHCSFETGKVEDANGRETCAKIAARLRELADKLDKVCVKALESDRTASHPT